MPFGIRAELTGWAVWFGVGGVAAGVYAVAEVDATVGWIAAGCALGALLCWILARSG